ncbi:hypothetical protein MRX96_044162 [Rhipicephalus microplus]
MDIHRRSPCAPVLINLPPRSPAPSYAPRGVNIHPHPPLPSYQESAFDVTIATSLTQDDMAPAEWRYFMETSDLWTKKCLHLIRRFVVFGFGVLSGILLGMVLFARNPELCKIRA